MTDHYSFVGLLILLWVPASLMGQGQEDYARQREALSASFAHLPPGKFESFGKGVKVSFKTSRKQLALTFDACGGPGRGGYDEALITFLRKEQIPATLFLTGLWIDEHPDMALNLAKDSLFEIENHGLTHRPCSVVGASRYKIHGTKNVGEVIDEVSLNARKITMLNNRAPEFFRAATATSDAACSTIVAALGETIVNFDVLSGDAVAGAAAEVIATNILRQVHPGAIVIMHMNHPEWNGLEALKQVLPSLRRQGYSLVLLKDQVLLEKH